MELISDMGRFDLDRYAKAHSPAVLARTIAMAIAMAAAMAVAAAAGSPA